MPGELSCLLDTLGLRNGGARCDETPCVEGGEIDVLRSAMNPRGMYLAAGSDPRKGDARLRDFVLEVIHVMAERSACLAARRPDSHDVSLLKLMHV